MSDRYINGSDYPLEPGFGVGSNSNVLDAMVADAVSANIRRIHLPIGAYEIDRELDISGVMIEAVAGDATSLVMIDHNQTGIRLSGDHHGTPLFAGGLDGVNVMSGPGVEAGIAVHAGNGPGQCQPSEYKLRNMKIGGYGGGTWKKGIYHTGTSRLKPLGIRRCEIQDVWVTNCLERALTIQSGVAAYVSNFQAIKGSGSMEGASIEIGGKGDKRRAWNCHINSAYTSGELIYSWTSHLMAVGNFHGGIRDLGNNINPMIISPQSS